MRLHGSQTVLPISHTSNILVHVEFFDEKKLNLDGPDGYNYYWHDLQKRPINSNRRNSGGGSVMVRCVFCFVASKMDSKDYQGVLQWHLLSSLGRRRGLHYVFQQDSAAIHVSPSTRDWLHSQNIEVLAWPTCSPDLNPMENLWGISIRKICANSRQFQTTEELKKIIIESWNEISGGTSKPCMSCGLLDIGLEQGGPNDY